MEFNKEVAAVVAAIKQGIENGGEASVKAARGELYALLENSKMVKSIFYKQFYIIFSEDYGCYDKKDMFQDVLTEVVMQRAHEFDDAENFSFSLEKPIKWALEHIADKIRRYNNRVTSDISISDYGDDENVVSAIDKDSYGTWRRGASNASIAPVWLNAEPFIREFFNGVNKLNAEDCKLLFHHLDFFNVIADESLLNIRNKNGGGVTFAGLAKDCFYKTLCGAVEYADYCFADSFDGKGGFMSVLESRVNKSGGGQLVYVITDRTQPDVVYTNKAARWADRVKALSKKLRDELKENILSGREALINGL